MAGRGKETILPGDEVVIPYDMFIDECKRLKAVNGGLRSYEHKSRNVTVYGDLRDQPGVQVEAQLRLGISEIEATVTLGPELQPILGPANYEDVEHFIDDPNGSVDHAALLTTQEHLTGLFVEAFRVGTHVLPFLVIKVRNTRYMRVFFRRFFGVPMDYELPPEPDHLEMDMEEEASDEA
jgi:hypothetical protein